MYRCCAKLLQSCLTLFDLMGYSLLGYLCPWNPLGRITGVDYHALLQRILLIQRANPHLKSLVLAG